MSENETETRLPTWWLIVTMVAVYDFVVFVLLLTLAVWATWHPGNMNTPGTFESRLLTTWFLIGAVPAALMSFAAYLVYEKRPLVRA